MIFLVLKPRLFHTLRYLFFHEESRDLSAVLVPHPQVPCRRVAPPGLDAPPALHVPAQRSREASAGPAVVQSPHVRLSVFLALAARARQRLPHLYDGGYSVNHKPAIDDLHRIPVDFVDTLRGIVPRCFHDLRALHDNVSVHLLSQRVLERHGHFLGSVAPRGCRGQLLLRVLQYLSKHCILQLDGTIGSNARIIDCTMY